MLNEKRVDKIIQLVANGVCDNEDRELLANSLFYYCCGSDATPIIAFKDQYPLYVYVDTVGYGGGDFNEEVKRLYSRLKKSGLKKIEFIHDGARYGKQLPWEDGSKPVIKQSELSRWMSEEGNDFYLLYVQGDAYTVYSKLYDDNERGIILPKCICNYKYEVTPSFRNDIVCCSSSESWRLLTEIEKQVEYVMGESKDKFYKEVARFKYYGGTWDSEFHTIPLFKRTCYYVF